MLQRGTTPTIGYGFSKVSVADIVECYLTVMQNGKLLFEKDLSSASVDIDEETISWQLTQEETLAFDEKAKISMQIRYKLTGGEAYASKVVEESVYRILKDGVI